MRCRCEERVEVRHRTECIHVPLSVPLSREHMHGHAPHAQPADPFALHGRTYSGVPGTLSSLFPAHVPHIRGGAGASDVATWRCGRRRPRSPAGEYPERQQRPQRCCPGAFWTPEARYKCTPGANAPVITAIAAVAGYARGCVVHNPGDRDAHHGRGGTPQRADQRGPTGGIKSTRTLTRSPPQRQRTRPRGPARPPVMKRTPLPRNRCGFASCSPDPPHPARHSACSRRLTGLQGSVMRSHRR
jgi:hypothetical protein